MRRINKTAFSIILSYAVLTGGMRMFLMSCANSYNKLNEDKVPTARLTVGEKSAQLDILGKKMRFGYISESDSRGFLAAYLFIPDELRTAVLIASDLYDRR